MLSEPFITLLEDIAVPFQAVANLTFIIKEISISLSNDFSAILWNQPEKLQLLIKSSYSFFYSHLEYVISEIILYSISSNI